MNDIYNNRYFILLKKKKILFHALDTGNKVVLKKEFFINDYSIKNVFSIIEEFLKKNIFEIEKNLKNFIKEIYIIFESDLFFVAGSSVKYNIQKTDFVSDNIKDLLLEIRNQFKKFSPKEEIIHMIVDKYILDGHIHEVLPKDIDSDNLIIQVNFICLDNQIVNGFKKIFSKYQISVNKILSYDFLKGINHQQSDNIFDLADNSINGLYKNEVFITDKIHKNRGFFEKFFNFFS